VLVAYIKPQPVSSSSVSSPGTQEFASSPPAGGYTGYENPAGFTQSSQVPTQATCSGYQVATSSVPGVYPSSLPGGYPSGNPTATSGKTLLFPVRICPNIIQQIRTRQTLASPAVAEPASHKLLRRNKRIN
jgi:hypothetical protein